MSDKPDFACEYAKSDRSGCKLCKTNIGMSALRMAIYVQSPFFDGKMPNWYHFNCFWKKEKPIDTAFIKGFDNLRWDDQQKIKKKMGLETNDESEEEKKDGDEIEKFSIEYSKSNRSKCKKCLTRIDKDVIRVGAKGTASIDGFYHLDCFAEAKSEIGFNHKIEEINGYNDLNEEDKKKASNLIKPPNQK
ncbi:poly [ADP-ribose] polymerase 1, partial [Brachionus plicatilis]